MVIITFFFDRRLIWRILSKTRWIRKIRFLKNYYFIDNVPFVALATTVYFPYITEYQWIEKITVTKLQPQRTVFEYFAEFKNVAHSLELVRRRVTRRLTKLQTMFNALRYGKTWWNNDTISIYRNRNRTRFFVILIMTSTVQNSRHEKPVCTVLEKANFEGYQVLKKCVVLEANRLRPWSRLQPVCNFIKVLIHYEISQIEWVNP